MALETVTIRGGPGQQDLYLTAERVLTGLCQLLDQGRLDEAVEVYTRCEQDLGFALIAAARSDVERFRQVAKLLFRAHDFFKAAQCCEALDEPEKAAALYERAGDAGQAAAIYARLADKARAAACFQKAGQLHSAAQLYDELGDAPRAAECRARAGHAPSLEHGALRVMEGFEALRALPLLAEASLSELRALHHLMDVCEHAPGHVLIDVGRPADALWVLLEGEVEISGEAGATMATIGPGAYVGVMSLLNEEPANARAVVRRKIRSLRLRRPQLAEALAAHDGLALVVYRAMARDFAARLRETSRRVL